jgi:hypothetical protein
VVVLLLYVAHSNVLCAVQVIAQPDERYDDYCRSSDFIREHIFPGAGLQSPLLLGCGVVGTAGHLVHQRFKTQAEACQRISKVHTHAVQWTTLPHGGS